MRRKLDHTFTPAVDSWWVVDVGGCREIVRVGKGKKCLPNTYSPFYVERVGTTTRIPIGSVSIWHHCIHSHALAQSRLSAHYLRGNAKELGRKVTEEERHDGEISRREISLFSLHLPHPSSEIPQLTGYLVYSEVSRISTGGFHDRRMGYKKGDQVVSVSEAEFAPGSLDTVMSLYGSWKLTGGTQQ